MPSPNFAVGDVEMLEEAVKLVKEFLENPTMYGLDFADELIDGLQENVYKVIRRLKEVGSK